MHPIHHLALAAAVGLALLLSSCSGGHDSDSREHGISESERDAGSGEHGSSESNGHDSESGEHGSSESERDDGDEESGTQFAKDSVYDETRSGARLILSYDADADAFVGTVENTTADTLSQVRVEVHLSNGVELGPTTPEDLPPGGITEIILSAEGEEFESWSAHPEVGRDEHGSSGEGNEGPGENGG